MARPRDRRAGGGAHASSRPSYAPRDGGFHLRLEYEGHTEVDGAFEAPSLVLTPGVPDPATGLRRHRDDLVARGAAPASPSASARLVDRADLLRLGRAVPPLRDRRRLADGAGDAGELRRASSTRSSARGSTPGTVVDRRQVADRLRDERARHAKWPDLKAGSRRGTQRGSTSCSGGRRGTRRVFRPSSASATRTVCRLRSTRRTRRRARRWPSRCTRCSARTGSTPTGSKSTSPRARRAAAHCRHRRRRLGDRPPARAARGRLPRGEGGQARRARDHADPASGVRRRRPT